MAQKIHVELVDDLDGESTKDVSTVSFGFAGRQFEIDLSAKNRGKLEKALEPYIAVARPVRGGSGKKSSRGGGGSGVDTKAVREWANANGIELAPRGRIPQNVVDQWKAATGN